jgi:apolipoprotein N-acyltransferase
VAEPRTQEVLLADVTLIDSLTPAIRIGAWSGRLAAVVTALGLLLALRTRPRRPKARPAPVSREPVAAR